MNHDIRISKIDDFSVVGGDVSDPAVATRHAQWTQRTAEVLAAAGDFEPRGLLSASFIYAHPPDYRGRASLNFGVTEWREVFREFKALGISTAIWQSSGFLELGECYFPSQTLHGFRQWNAMEPMIRAAHDEGMSLYLGALCVLRGQSAFGADDGDIGKAAKNADMELACYRELVERYRGGFHGYYLSTETFYAPHRMPSVYKYHGAFFERVTAGVKALTPELKILASPAACGCAGHEQEAIDRLMECFGPAHVDMFAPMDCVGQVQDLGMMEANLGVWREVCRAKGAAFWSNCESFLITDYQGEVMKIEAADPRRFLYQLTVAERMGATALITWEAMHFMNPRGDPKSQALRRAYLEHRDRLCRFA